MLLQKNPIWVKNSLYWKSALCIAGHYWRAGEALFSGVTALLNVNGEARALFLTSASLQGMTRKWAHCFTEWPATARNRSWRASLRTFGKTWRAALQMQLLSLVLCCLLQHLRSFLLCYWPTTLRVKNVTRRIGSQSWGCAGREQQRKVCRIFGNLFHCKLLV